MFDPADADIGDLVCVFLDLVYVETLEHPIISFDTQVLDADIRLRDARHDCGCLDRPASRRGNHSVTREGTLGHCQLSGELAAFIRQRFIDAATDDLCRIMARHGVAGSDDRANRASFHRLAPRSSSFVRITELKSENGPILMYSTFSSVAR